MEDIDDPIKSLEKAKAIERGAINLVERQGNYLHWRKEEKYSRPEVSNKRGQVKMFTRSSRMRLLRSFARLDWEKNGMCLFITLTFPDSVHVQKNYKMNIYRWVFWRYLEKWAGRKVSGMWRCEWKPRLSGIQIGEYMPHLHLLVFGEDFIPWQEVNWWWMNTLSVRHVCTDVQAVRDIDLATSYVSKYIAKTDLHYLDNAAYLNNVPPGRCWGWFRH
jgi:hypothetical protein